MKIYLALLVLCLGMFSGALADRVPARILIGTSEAPLAPSPVHDGAGVLAPLQVVSLLGATYVDTNDGNLIVTAAEGHSGTIGTVNIDGTRMIPMDKLITLIGGERRWDASKRTLTLLAHLNSVEFDNDTLKINCSFPVRATAKVWDGKMIVDVANTKLVSEAKEVYIGSPIADKARLGQYSETTARVVLETKKPVGYKFETTGAAAQTVIKVNENLPIPQVVQPEPKQSKNQPFTIDGVAIQTVNESSFTTIVNTTGKANAINTLKVSPPQILVDFPNGQISTSCEVTGAHTLVNPTLTKTATGARLTLGLARPMAYGVEVRNSQIMVYVRPPDKSGGTLAGKLIVVDAGHGGEKDLGAQAGGCKEKDINLRLAQDLVAALEKEGVRTVLTRESDQAIGLSARPEVAIRAGADFFVSLHCNSNFVPDSTSGIETYYHMQEPSPKLLACSIHDAVCQLTGMRDGLARSDRKLHATGLAVLRRLSDTGIPGILLECGYVNNSSDRAKLLDSGYRAKLVAGIIAGLRAYVEGSPIPY